MVSLSSTPDTNALKPVQPKRRFATMRAVAALMLREMNTTYGRSPGGYIWEILQPVAGIAVLAAVFSVGFRSPPIGTSFAMFYATGILPFFFFLTVVNKLAQALNFSKQLLAYPSITYIDALLGRFILNTLTQLLVGYIVLAGLLALFETRTTLELDRIALAYAMVTALSLGIGTMNCFLTSMFPVWQQVWNIVTRPLIIVSGVIFMYDNTPEPYRSYLWYNPLIHVTGEMRAAFYVSYEASYVSPLYVFALSLALLMFGLLFLRRYHRDILNY
tara:strand:- start:661 stop:1482 length:822 start_codon:yes stop_codon:yes gene_type:complete